MKFVLNVFFLSIAGIASAQDISSKFDAPTQVGMVCQKFAENDDYDISEEHCHKLAEHTFKLCSERDYSDIIVEQVKKTGLTEKPAQELLAFATYRLQLSFCIYKETEPKMAPYKRTIGRDTQ